MSMPVIARHRHSPRVRRLATERGVALETISGTGPQGRVSPADVLQAAARQPAATVAGAVAAQHTTVTEVDVTRVVALTGRVPLTAFCAKAALEALRSHPLLGAGRDLCLAVDTVGGRRTQVIKNAGDLNLMALAREISEASTGDAAAQAFTFTDSGSLGALFEIPVITQPQAGALALGTVAERPVAIRHQDGSYAIAIRSVAHLALTYDLLSISGAYAASYLRAVKARLEAADFATDLR